MKLFLTFSLLFLFLFSPGISHSESEIEINCTGGAILVEYNTSKAIFEQNADTKWPPASITKVMTAIIALEKGNMSEEVRFSENATKQEGSKLGLEEGVSVPFYPLIEAMLVRSGNDASVAIAEHIAESESDFAKLMNQKAKALAMFDTNFVNSSGLPDDDQYTTARDLAKLAVYSMGVREFRSIVAKSKVNFINKDDTEDKILHTTNQLLGRHPLVDGIKTGYTQKSRFCLAASAAFRDYRLISVVLGAENPEVYLESARLLDWGFAKHDTLYPLYREFEVTIPIQEGEPEEG